LFNEDLNNSNLNDSNSNKDKDFLFRALLELKSDIIDIKKFLVNLNIQNRQNQYYPDNDKQDLNNDFVIQKNILMKMTMDDIEKEVLIFLLDNNNGNIERVAEVLRQTPRNIYRKMKSYNINR